MTRADNSVGVDWEDLKRRLRATEEAIHDADAISPERRQEILSDRAKRLATVVDDGSAPHDEIEVVTFGLGNESLAIETRFVHELAHATETTPIPATPEYLVGVTNVRGTITAVMDVRALLGIDTAAQEGPATFLLVGGEQPEFGMVVDEIGQVAKLAREEIVAVPRNISSETQTLLKGVTQAPMLVIDGDMLLAAKELWIDETEW